MQANRKAGAMMYELLNKVSDTVKPAIALMGAVLTWLMFPEQSFVVWCIATWVAVVLDLFTRWFAIFVKSGGIAKAFTTKAWNSEAMFHKTSIKIVAYLVIQILAGLSMRLVTIPYVSNIVATVVYSFLFFREFASNIENLIDAGADYLQPLLFWIRKKEDEIYKDDKEEK
jgi:glucan phosphoethanolaminetransferase (alkaline phosphatase superfamily)